MVTSLGECDPFWLQHVKLTMPMRVLRLSFLAPDLIEAILNGWQPPELTLERFRRPIPLEWARQRQYFSFPLASCSGTAEK
jgi:hypothetical protein